MLIEALYSEATEHTIDAQVKFEDGRVGNIRATLRHCDAQAYPVRAA